MSTTNKILLHSINPTIDRLNRRYGSNPSLKTLKTPLLSVPWEGQEYLENQRPRE
jgi:hypothetical protein